MKFSDLAVGPSPQLAQSTYATRRKTLAKKLGDGDVLLVATHTPKQYSNDVEYLYRPHSDFWYLTGFAEPGALLMLEGGAGRSTLWLRDREPEREIWTGRRLGVTRAKAALGVDRAHSLADLAGTLPDALKGAKRVHAITAHDPAVHRRVLSAAGKRLVKEPKAVQAGGPQSALLAKAKAKAPTHPHARQVLALMRARKDADELRMLRRACGLGVEAHLESAKHILGGRNEFEVEAAFAHHARRHGSTGVGYPSICGCGPNAAVLHYVSNLDGLRGGELFLVDAGCEWGYYTSDITRTYPVGGSFTPMQQKLYELVYEAQRQGVKEVRPGKAFRAAHDKCVDILTQGLLDLGLLQGSFEKAIEGKTYRSFFMHGTSHYLGLDVHDAGPVAPPGEKPVLLQEGMCITVEPGLYFNPDFAKCPPGTAGIGIRIEDDVAVTDGAPRNFTKALPTRPEDVAALVGRR